MVHPSRPYPKTVCYYFSNKAFASVRGTQNFIDLSCECVWYHHLSGTFFWPEFFCSSFSSKGTTNFEGMAQHLNKKKRLV